MITEEEKYRVDIFKIIGFALMTPFGRAITDPYLFKDFGLNIMLIYIMYTFVLFIFGIASLFESYVILNVKWKIQKI